MKTCVCFKQGNGSHRYLKFPPTTRNPAGLWYGGYGTAHDFGDVKEAQRFIASIPPEDLDPSGPWLGECSLPFVTTEDLP